MRSAIARQGRLEEAERLLLGFDDRVEAAAPLTLLYTARGDYNLAAAVARRGVRLLGTYWTVGYGDAVARLRNSKGIAYLADLLAHPGVERHVFDLVDLVEGGPGRTGRGQASSR